MPLVFTSTKIMVQSYHNSIKIHFLLFIPINTTSLEYKGTDQTKQA